MSLSLKLKKFLLKQGACEVGYADITNFTPKPGLTSGVVFYITYPKEIIRNMENAPTQEYVDELVSLNSRLDALGMKCEEFLIDEGYDAYAQTKKRLGTDFGEFNSFELPHKTIATRAGLGWIGRSALFVTPEYGSAVALSAILTDMPLDFATPITDSQCDDCTNCQDACPVDAINPQKWNDRLNRKDIIDIEVCREYIISQYEAGLGCTKCMSECKLTQEYLKRD